MVQYGDVIKVDIGVHVKGRICDSAFTLAFNDDYKELMDAVKDATNTGVRVRSTDRVLNHSMTSFTRKQALMFD